MAKKIKSKDNLQTGRKYLHHVGLISLLCKELLKNQRTQDQNLIAKWRKHTNKQFTKKKDLNDLKPMKKMFKITHNQRNANRNNTDISFLSYDIGNNL